MTSSVAGRIGAPFLAPYAASKHALEGFAESLRRELAPLGIAVVIVAPGHVVTPIWDKAEQMDITPYLGLPITPALQRFRERFIRSGRDGLPPARVAEAIKRALTCSRPKIREVVVAGRLLNRTLPRLLGPRFVDRMLSLRLQDQRRTR